MFRMVSKGGQKVLCNFPGCGKEAVAGCELRIDAGHGGDHITIPGGLVAWCESHEESLLDTVSNEYVLLDLDQLKAAFTTRSNQRGRST